MVSLFTPVETGQTVGESVPQSARKIDTRCMLFGNSSKWQTRDYLYGFTTTILTSLNSTKKRQLVGTLFNLEFQSYRMHRLQHSSSECSQSGYYCASLDFLSWADQVLVNRAIECVCVLFFLSINNRSSWRIRQLKTYHHRRWVFQMWRFSLQPFKDNYSSFQSLSSSLTSSNWFVK